MEIDEGNFKLNIKQKELHPVAEYLKPQGRFRHLSEEQLDYLQKDAQSEWNAILELEKSGRFPMLPTHFYSATLPIAKTVYPVFSA